MGRSRGESRNQSSGSSQPPATPAERAQWFVNATVEETQELADFHGDHTDRHDIHGNPS